MQRTKTPEGWIRFVTFCFRRGNSSQLRLKRVGKQEDVRRRGGFSEMSGRGCYRCHGVTGRRGYCCRRSAETLRRHPSSYAFPRDAHTIEGYGDYGIAGLPTDRAAFGVVDNRPKARFSLDGSTAPREGVNLPRVPHMFRGAPCSHAITSRMNGGD